MDTTVGHTIDTSNFSVAAMIEWDALEDHFYTLIDSRYFVSIDRLNFETYMLEVYDLRDQMDYIIDMEVRAAMEDRKDKIIHREYFDNVSDAQSKVFALISEAVYAD